MSSFSTAHFTDGGVAFARSLRDNPNQGPWKIEIHRRPPFSPEGLEGLEAALMVNQHLNTFKLGADIPADNDFTALFRGIKSSRSICTLEIRSTLSDQNWAFLLDCIGGHPKITSLKFGHYTPLAEPRSHELVQTLLSSNSVITTVNLHFNKPISREDRLQLNIILEANRYRVRALEITTKTLEYRSRRLAFDLIAFSNKPWLLFALLHNNVDILGQNDVVVRGQRTSGRKRKQPMR